MSANIQPPLKPFDPISDNITTKINKKRLELHEILRGFISITEPDGDSHIYFDPPMGLKMRFPAIRYKRKPISKVYANNAAYALRTPYEIILIDKNPESEYLGKILNLPYCEHDRHYTADNLHHDVFTIYI